MLDRIGAGGVIWGAYPHCEGTCAFTLAAGQQVLDTVSFSDAKEILDDTAPKVFASRGDHVGSLKDLASRDLDARMVYAEATEEA